jgi:hypothetical protein
MVNHTTRQVETFLDNLDGLEFQLKALGIIVEGFVVSFLFVMRIALRLLLLFLGACSLLWYFLGF